MQLGWLGKPLKQDCILWAWGARDGGSVGRGGGRSVQGLLHRDLGRSAQPGGKSLLTPSWGGLRTFSSLRIFGKFQQRSFLLLLILFHLQSCSPPPKPLLLMLKSQQGLERVRRFSYQWRPKTLRTPSWSRMWSPKLKMQSLSPRLRIPNPRQLISRKTPRRPSYRDLFSYLSLCIFLLLWCFHHCL